MFSKTWKSIKNLLNKLINWPNTRPTSKATIYTSRNGDHLIQLRVPSMMTMTQAMEARDILIAAIQKVLWDGCEFQDDIRNERIVKAILDRGAVTDDQTTTRQPRPTDPKSKGSQ